MTYDEAIAAARGGSVVSRPGFRYESGLRWHDVKGRPYSTDPLGFKYQFWPLRDDREARDWFVLSADGGPR